MAGSRWLPARLRARQAAQVRADKALRWLRLRGGLILGGAALFVAAHYFWSIDQLKDDARADRKRQEASERRQAASEVREACQARYNTAVVGQIKARAVVTETRDAAEARADEATDALLSGFATLALTAPPDAVRTPEQEAADRTRSLDLFSGYQSARAEVAGARAAVVKTRAQNPLPDFPDC